jgi:ribose 1,5-bisphosphokinase
MRLHAQYLLSEAGARNVLGAVVSGVFWGGEMSHLIYLMGPSGSGKDSLLNAARDSLQARGCYIARRVITRSAEAVGEDAVSVDAQEFARLKEQGAFALSWQANGLAYGIPRVIDDWLGGGHDVVVNGSRAHLPAARARYSQLQAVLLEVDEAVLRQRLLSRGRESAKEIDARLGRSARLRSDAGMEGVWRLDNSDSLEMSVAHFLQWFDGLPVRHPDS